MFKLAHASGVNRTLPLTKGDSIHYVSQMRVLMCVLAASLFGADCGVAQQSAAGRPAITGIAYVRFFESDLPAAKVFYAQRLGLPETDLAGGLSVFAVNARQKIEVVPLPASAPPNRLAEVAFLTTDVSAMQRYLEAHGVASQMDHGELKLRDPEGNPIGFVEDREADAGAASKPVGAAPVQTSRRIIHAGYGVRDRVTEDTFYRALLGFRPYWYGGSTPDKVSWVSLQVPEGSDWLEYMLDFDPGHDSLRQLGGMDHVSLGVNKITDVTDRLIANGWTDAATRKSQIGRDGKWQLNVFDPDQSRVEFMEFRPVREPCCSVPTAPPPEPDPAP